VPPKSDTMTRVGALDQLGGVRLVTLDDGAERGVRVVEFRTATGLDFGVVVDRAMDIGWFRHQGRSVAWHSPTGWVGPWFREIEGLGWLRSFAGGLTATCGLDHILFPQDDPADTYNYPGRTVTEYGLHGRISNVPATLRSYGTKWEGDSCELFAEAEVRQVGALAENLVLRRRISVDLFGTTVSLEDVVTNEGHYPTPHMLLYHINLGAPLLDSACELVAPSREITWRTPSATGGPDEHLHFADPTPGFVEQAFEHVMVPDADGQVTVGLVNRRGAQPWGIALEYDGKAFPHFFQWRYFDAGTYVTGLEPSTNGISGRLDARETGHLTLLDPGESRSYRSRFSIVEGEAEWARLADAARAAVNSA
jgi:hypothetical protein